jgi:hypothetical protein
MPVYFLILERICEVASTRALATQSTLDVQRILCHTLAMTNDKPPQYRDKRLQQFVAGYRVRDFQSFERQLKKG